MFSLCDGANRSTVLFGAKMSDGHASSAKRRKLSAPADEGVPDGASNHMGGSYVLPMTRGEDPSAYVRRGRSDIRLAEETMPALVDLRKGWKKTKPFVGLRIGVNLHVTKETAVLVKTLRDGGAECFVAGCNAFSTNDDVATALAAEKQISVFAVRGNSKEQFYKNLKSVISHAPDIIVDDGCDLTVELHKLENEAALRRVRGICEQTTSGVLRARNMEKSGNLQTDVVATNDNKTKHLLDNFYGTGQSVWDSIMRASATFLAGKTVCCVGYGHCGKGIALRAKGLGAKILVTEVDPFAALQATYDGYTVMPLDEAAKIANIFVTATGSRHAISLEHIKTMKRGAILANAGQFPIEIAVDELRAVASDIAEVRPGCERIEISSDGSGEHGNHVYLLGGGNLVNLACGEGHPSEVMATSFLGQALACNYINQEFLKRRSDETDQPRSGHVINLPVDLDDEIASLQLKAMGIAHDTLTKSQKEYATAWQEGY